MTLDETLARYAELLRRIDDKFAEIQARYPQAFACRAGCHSCCRPDLRVNRLEAENIRRFLAERPELAARLVEMERKNPHRGKRCPFLGGNGACGIYEARPMVCRSHGAPLQYRESSREDSLRLRDVCELNFTDTDLAGLPPDAVLNLDTLNTLLALLTQQAFGKDANRTDLRPSALAPTQS